ncbi:MAG: hypothetical protein IMZ47_04385, partial [Firmicutes bacterium]|nr:hypothetical protein [Bacillota bacterium]
QQACKAFKSRSTAFRSASTPHFFRFSIISDNAQHLHLDAFQKPVKTMAFSDISHQIKNAVSFLVQHFSKLFVVEILVNPHDYKVPIKALAF